MPTSFKHRTPTMGTNHLELNCEHCWSSAFFTNGQKSFFFVSIWVVYVSILQYLLKKWNTHLNYYLWDGPKRFLIKSQLCNLRVVLRSPIVSHVGITVYCQDHTAYEDNQQHHTPGAIYVHVDTSGHNSTNSTKLCLVYCGILSIHCCCMRIACTRIMPTTLCIIVVICQSVSTHLLPQHAHVHHPNLFNFEVLVCVIN